MDLLFTKIFFEEQSRNMKKTKNDGKTKNFIKICFLLCVEDCSFEPPSWRRVYFIIMLERYICFCITSGRGFESCKEVTLIFHTGFRSHLDLGHKPK